MLICVTLLATSVTTTTTHSTFHNASINIKLHISQLLFYTYIQYHTVSYSSRPPIHPSSSSLFHPQDNNNQNQSLVHMTDTHFLNPPSQYLNTPSMLINTLSIHLLNTSIPPLETSNNNKIPTPRTRSIPPYPTDSNPYSLSTIHHPPPFTHL